MSWAERVGSKERKEQSAENQSRSQVESTFESLLIYTRQDTKVPGIRNWEHAFYECLRDLSTYANLDKSTSAQQRFETYHSPRLAYLLPAAHTELEDMDEDDMAETTRFHIYTVVWGKDLFMAVDWYTKQLK